MTAQPASKFFAFREERCRGGSKFAPEETVRALFGDEDRRALFGSFVEYEDEHSNQRFCGVWGVRSQLISGAAGGVEVRMLNLKKRNPASSGSAADGYDSATGMGHYWQSPPAI
jgi:hypothetical protein